MGGTARGLAAFQDARAIIERAGGQYVTGCPVGARLSHTLPDARREHRLEQDAPAAERSGTLVFIGDPQFAMPVYVGGLQTLPTYTFLAPACPSEH